MKTILLALSATVLLAHSITLNDIHVTSSYIKPAKPVVSSGLASTLLQTHPSISMIRRAGTSNNIILRGMDNDNINVIVNGTKTYGACPNRMDPPISHVDINDIKSIKIIEGPYDVQNLNTLSGAVKIGLKQPKKGLHGRVYTNFGSFGYKNAGLGVSGGDKIIKILISGAIATSDQYKDGRGDTLAQQTKNNASPAHQYNQANFNKKAYLKKNLATKIFLNLTDNQKLKFGYTADRNNDILYPSTAMDAIFDNTDLYNLQYDISNIGKFSKKLILRYYQSDVDHLMSNRYRNYGTKLKDNHLKSQTQGLKLQNRFNVKGYKVTVGAIGSKRYWSGALFVNNRFKIEDIPDVDTYSSGAYIKIGKRINHFSYTVGSNFSFSNIESPSYQTKYYSALNGYILTHYKLDAHNKLMFGVGKSSRLPDAKELYFKLPGNMAGNANLKQVSNYETDIGLSSSYNSFLIKTKAFYSKIKNYILYDAQINQNNYQNIDASIYGFSAHGTYFITSHASLQGGLAYGRGVKDTLATNQHSKNLPNIAPLKGDISLKYNYRHNSYIQAKVIASNEWSKYDSDDGEQKIAGWSILDLKVSHGFGKHLLFIAGVNNVFNTNYAISNTYKALSLLSGGSGVMLLNEPGRYIYANLTLRY